MSSLPVALHKETSEALVPLCALLLARGCFHRMSVVFQECSARENYCCALLYLDAFKDKKCLFSTLFFQALCFLAVKGPQYLYFQGMSILYLSAWIIPWGCSSPFLDQSYLSPKNSWGPGVQCTEIHPHSAPARPENIPQSQSKIERHVMLKIKCKCLNYLNIITLLI